MERQIHHFRLYPQIKEFTIEDFPVNFRVLQVRANVLVVETEVVNGKVITEDRVFRVHNLYDIVETREYFIGVIISSDDVMDDRYLYFKD